MRITILSVGSRGDVQPYVALGKGLAAAGHEVRLATHSAFEGFVRGHGLDFGSVGLDPFEILKEVIPDWHVARRHPVRLVRKMKAILGPVIDEYLAGCASACQGSEAIVFSPLGSAGWHVAESLRVPRVLAMIQPLEPTQEFPSPLVPQALGRLRLLNRSTYTMNDLSGWIFSRSLVNGWRAKTLGLPPLPWLESPQERMRAERVVTLHAYSEAVSPRAPDWGETTHVTGYWFLDGSGSWTPPQPLARFLADGPPPVFVGFGSVFGHDPRKLAKTVVEALRLSGQRGVLLTGHGALDGTEVPPEIHAIEEAPFEWLFPRMSAVVHHGGVGTVGASLQAGRPTVVVPFFFDQPFWGDRVARLGAGPAPIPVSRLTPERLAVAIRQAVSDEGIARRAAEIGRAIRAEDGVGRAVEVLERVLSAR